jgi:peptide/nickel transport system permease protein
MRFVIRRAGFFLLTLWAALSLNFLLPHIMPGNPMAAILAKLHSPSHAEILSIQQQLGYKPGASLWPQYFTYLGHTLTGNLGYSFYMAEPVSKAIESGIFWTLGLVGTTTIIGFVLGTAIGAIAAWRRGSRLDSVLPPLFIFTTALPFFWVGMVLIIIFSNSSSLGLGIFPAESSYTQGIAPTLSLSYIIDVIEHAVLPAMTLLITGIGGWILTMRNTMVTTLTEDYVRMARAKGLPGRQIMWSYAARNALLPNLTGFAMSLGFVVSGAILVEYVFNYQGVGWMLLNAVGNTDYPLMQGLFLIITVAVLIAILLSDIATALLDPRTRTAG